MSDKLDWIPRFIFYSILGWLIADMFKGSVVMLADDAHEDSQRSAIFTLQACWQKQPRVLTYVRQDAPSVSYFRRISK